MRRVGLLVVVTGALLATGCVESEMRTTLKADGTGNLQVSAKVSESMVKLMQRMKKSAASAGAASGMNPADLDKAMKLNQPDEAAIKAMAAKGLTVETIDSKVTDTEMWMKMRLGFERLGSLEAASALDGGRSSGTAPTARGVARALRLTRADSGIYTLAMVMTDMSNGEDAAAADETGRGPAPGGLTAEAEKEAKGGEAAGPAKDAPAEEAEDPMALMGELMEELQNLKIVLAFDVPGEIVDYTPEHGAEKKGGSLVWTLDMGAMMAIQMEGVDTFQVRFKMPEGTAIPASALWSGKAEAAAAAPTTTPPPAPPAPAGEGAK